MPSQLQLVNRALSELGRNAVVSVTDSPDALYLNAKINELFPEVLLRANWNFAVRYREDDTPLTSVYTPDYSYTYQLPGDFGRFFKWASTGSQWPVYQFANGYLLAQTRPVQYWYVVNQCSPEVLPPLFSRALILYAACKAAPSLTNNIQLSSYLAKEYEKALYDAMIQNDMERPVFTQPYNDYDRLQYI